MSTRALILANIVDERDRQDGTWGANQHLPVGFWLSILVEEVGELAAEMSRAQFECAITQERSERLASEAIQVAAVAIAFLEALAFPGVDAR